MEREETCEEAAVREAKEETGLEVKLGGVLSRGVVVDKKGKEMEYVLYGAELVGGELRVGSGDVDKTRWVSRKEIEGDEFPLREGVLKEVLLGVGEGKQRGVGRIEVGVKL